MSLFESFVAVLTSDAAKERARDRLLRTAALLPAPILRAGARALASLPGANHSEAPETLFFFVTNKCNQSCIHCFYAAELNIPQQGMTLDNIKTMCRSLQGRVKTVFLCGGEPTTRKDLPEIVEAFIEDARVRRLFITTNGLLRKRLFETVDRALASDRRFQLRIPISLDGPEAIHDAIRKSPGGYRRALETLDALRDRAAADPRLTPLVTSVIQKGNAESFVDFYKEIRESIGCELQFILLRQDGRDAGGLDRTLLLDAGNAEDLLPDRESCERILNEIADYEMRRAEASSVPLLRAAFARKHLDLVERAAPVAPCIAPRTFATVFPDGGTSLCEIVRPYGSLAQHGYDLLAAWKSEEAAKQRGDLAACWCTYPCALHTSLMRDPDALVETIGLVKRDLRRLS